MSGDGLYLGGVLDSGERTGETVNYAAHNFTTHGVIVGMTGSGKTGLGMVLLEEALLSGVPALIIDPKGDMGNLALSFPEFRPEDFRPWVDDAEARRKGQSPDELAADTAAIWQKGLASWDIQAERLRRLSAKADTTIYTPGSSAGVSLNVVGALDAPTLDWAEHGETLIDEIESYVSSLLTMAGITADPVASVEHILLSNLIGAAWRKGQSLDLALLIGQVVQPPIRKLGVFDLDTFFPPAARMKLAMRLNGLVASPSFSAWLEGPPLDIQSLLYTPDGRPRAAVMYLSHLSDAERQMVVTLLLSRMVTWMRRQKGTSDLRALIYMDEVFGYCPPTARPPSKKPILTILKQARAFGVGMILSTQNPVDLDYKAMSNAGTWMIGRLQTERDKARILEGLRSAAGGVDVDALDVAIGGLGKRQFVLHSARAAAPTLFTTRWAQSYLAGPLTRDQVARLTADAPTPAASRSATVPSAAAPPAAFLDDEDIGTSVAPAVADGIAVRYLDAAAAWADAVDAVRGGTRFEARLAARVNMVFDDTRAGVDHQAEYEVILTPRGKRIDVSAGIPVDYDKRDFRDEAPEGARWDLPEAPIDKKQFFKGVAVDLRAHLVRQRSVTVQKNKPLKLWSRVGESLDAFEIRCREAAEDRADEDTAKLRDKFRKRIDRCLDQISAAESRVRELENKVESLQSSEVVSGAGALLSMFLGGKVRSRSLSAAAGRRGRTSQAQQRLRTANETVDDKQMALESLEADFQDDLLEITARWDDRASTIEEVKIGLEKSDVRVDEIRLVWIPTE